MKLLSEMKVLVRRGLLPHFINELYKSSCEIRSIGALERQGDMDLFLAEILYDDAVKFKEVMDKLGRHPDNFRVESVRNVLEDMIRGGLLSITGKTSIENRADYEMMLQGATDLMVDRILHEKKGAEYSGTNRCVGILNCFKEREDFSPLPLLAANALAERDSLVLGRFAGVNAFPLLVRYQQIEDLVKVIRSVRDSFAAIRIAVLDDSQETDAVAYINSEIDRPVLYREYDELPLLLTYAIMHIMKKKNMTCDECNAGIIGIDLCALRLTRILLSMGISRVLGSDNNEKLMMNFEKEGGMATTQENIFSNTDIIILLKNHFTIDDLARIRPGQVIISLIDDEDIDQEIIERKGIRDIIHGRWCDLSVIFPGLIAGMLKTGVKNLSDAALLRVAESIARRQKDDFMPDVFSNIHEEIALALRES